MATERRALHAEGVRAVKRTMTHLEETGACWFENKYYSDEMTLDLARKRAAERDERWSRRREAFVARVARAMGLLERDDETALALALQRESVALDPTDVLDEAPCAPGYCDTAWEREHFARAHPILCAWCLAEGSDAVIQTGNPDLTPSRWICDRHSRALVGFATDGVAWDGVA